MVFTQYAAFKIGAKYVSNEMLRRFQNFSACLCNVPAKNTAQDSAETCAYYGSNGFGMPQHFSKGYDLIGEII